MLGWRGAIVTAALALAGVGPAWADAQQTVTTVCVVCHGEGGRSLVPIFPRLAGQQAEYLAKQLNDFMTGKRKNAVMAPILDTITAADVAGLAAYYAAQTPTTGAPIDAALAAIGKQLFEDGNGTTGVPACAGCHQPMAEGNARFPRLAGQHQGYLVKQIIDFKSGERVNDKARVMRTVAERLTEQEINAVAEYLSSL
jgi:cytochrome c553